MSAVLAAKTDYPDRYPVPYIEKKPMNDPAAKADPLILNIQKDVTDLRADVRAMNGQIDTVRQSVDALRDRMDRHREDDKKALDARFEKVDVCLAEMRKETKADLTAMTSRIDRMTDRVDGTYKWAVALFMAGLGALGGLMAHGFKWF